MHYQLGDFALVVAVSIGLVVAISGTIARA
jgi:hypothetical protein